ncbi:3-hydroxyisobutyryl-CoA hydrolase-like protein [Rhynchospora pubera]|uniref:3-hydroxyisobutyryl-CoA hydrolase n=1 Tax=Rhynchospora pubera TaxID=906938 RepID=A0AAV8H9W0_9POAL|nr:3-hydroxyisobutyryl-CoA hydrolase-like protein [Rhynchospora pubera]
MVIKSRIGHWIFAAHYYVKLLTLCFSTATLAKPVVFLLNGVVMGAGAGFSLMGKFRVATENTVFAMPEPQIGHFPDVGASYFFSKLPGFFGEYMGLTGTKLGGAEMLASGLATHFVSSKNLEKLEESLSNIQSVDETIVHQIINQYSENPPLPEKSPLLRIDSINARRSLLRCRFSIADLRLTLDEASFDKSLASTFLSFEKSLASLLLTFDKSA